MSSTASITISCSSCEQQAKSLAEAHRRIADLEQQIEILTLRASDAINNATGYETELRRLNSTRSTAGRYSVESADSPIIKSAVVPASPPRTAASRLARLLPTRTISAPTTSMPLLTPRVPYDTSALSSPAPSEVELMEALSHEQELRKEAENAAAKSHSEIEELTVQLFSEANEMVATERKARAKLAERVQVLERRDGEKAQRLQSLETRIGRVERIRRLLSEDAAPT